MKTVSWHVGRTRLLKLAKHLRSKKLSVDKFAFATFRSVVTKEWDHDGDVHGVKVSKNFCGTVGCAIGECPAVFPRHWKLEQNTDGILASILKGSNPIGGFSAAIKFFGLREMDSVNDEVYALFNPGDQSEGIALIPGFKYLGDNATPIQVAKNIEAYVKWRDNGDK